MMSATLQAWFTATTHKSEKPTVYIRISPPWELGESNLLDIIMIVSPKKLREIAEHLRTAAAEIENRMQYPDTEYEGFGNDSATAIRLVDPSEIRETTTAE